ncbi:OB-fold protein [Filimonas effusa]|uniref:tRNA_anti-like n=1 Tax=Filimonas effusa TaxID=2508721 RepID=A0A4Q1D5R5_9BACT|nr:hypothetical protein [Filimonas effusa]RXK82967.1 hypothetical protein ESB13_12635 [Filimonas effusa]
MSKKSNYWLKRGLLVIIGIALLGAGFAWYLIREKFSDTSIVKADYTVTASSFIKEFEKEAGAANQKYTNKIIEVSGNVSEKEAPSDSVTNIKFIDTATGSYVIFAFQGQHMKEAQNLKQGAPVAIKGACSGGHFSEILGFTAIEFKRCALANTAK